MQFQHCYSQNRIRESASTIGCAFFMHLSACSFLVCRGLIPAFGGQVSSLPLPGPVFCSRPLQSRHAIGIGYKSSGGTRP
jgi:hypothetical protein